VWSRFSEFLRGIWEKRWGRALLLCLAAAVITAYLVTCAYKTGIFKKETRNAIRAAKPESGEKSKPESRIKLNDAAVFYLAGRYCFTDELYSFEAPPTAPGRPGRDFLYPPFFALLVWPLSLFGYTVFVILWLFLNAALAVLAVWICAKYLAKGKDEAIRWWMWLLPLLLTLRAFDANFRQGQANMLTLVFLAAAFAALGGRREILGGIAYALACVLKITPVLIFPYFILKRRWFFLLGWLLGLMATVIVIPSVLMGPEKAYRQFSAFYGKVGDPFVTKAGKNPREGAGQSLHAAVDRFLSPVDASRHDDENVTVNLASMSRETRYLIKLIFLFLLAVATGVVCRRKFSEQERLAQAIEYAAVVCFMLMAAPISRKASFVVMLIPYLAAVHYLARSERTGARLFFLIVFVFSIITHTFTTQTWITKTGSVYLLGFSIMFFGTLFLWSGYIVALSRKESDILDG
jgi:hypothetical protein